jgi:N-carbamoyl-L-amino-acid hydrolase
VAVRDLRIDGDRLWDSLSRMAEIGATPAGGVNRQALTDGDRAARDLFIAWCREAGCSVRIDSAGNIFARRAGRRGDAPAVAAGSHLDSQPAAGQFDGALGVLASLEVVRTLNDHGVVTERAVEVVSWTNEEGCRFAPSMMGSGVFTGRFDAARMAATADAEGRTFGAELERIGYRGGDWVAVSELGAWFELHIEQGPVLERDGTTVGVVTGAHGLRWFDLVVTGREAHAGPTPMPERRDALLGAARIVTTPAGSTPSAWRPPPMPRGAPSARNWSASATAAVSGWRCPNSAPGSSCTSSRGRSWSGTGPPSASSPAPTGCAGSTWS